MAEAWERWGWNLYGLSGELGPSEALEEMKRRGEAGAIAAWAIYKEKVEGLIRNSLITPEPAYRVSMLSDLRKVGEDMLVEKIEELHKEYPEGIPNSEAFELIEDWNTELGMRAGRKVPHGLYECTEEEMIKSDAAVDSLYVPLLPRVIDEELMYLEKMRAELEKRMRRLKGEEGAG